jgi:hypothetical protein
MNAPENAIHGAGHALFAAGNNPLLCGSMSPLMTQLKNMRYSSSRQPESAPNGVTFPGSHRAGVK